MLIETARTRKRTRAGRWKATRVCAEPKPQPAYRHGAGPVWLAQGRIRQRSVRAARGGGQGKRQAHPGEEPGALQPDQGPGGEWRDDLRGRGTSIQHLPVTERGRLPGKLQARNDGGRV